MSDSNNPTLQPPDAYRTQVNLRDVLAELLDEKFVGFRQEMSHLVDEKLAPVHQQLDRIEREHREFRQEMRRVISDLARSWQEQVALQNRITGNRLTDVEDRVEAVEQRLSQS